MDGRFDVTRAGIQIGVAELSQNGLMQDIYFSGNAPDNENVYRLAAVCGGQYVLIGVPVPDRNGRLTLKKSLSKTSVRALGFASPTGFELVLPDESYGDTEVSVPVNTGAGDWRPVAKPSVMFAENGALFAVDDIKGAFIREEDELVFLAIPVSESEPFPLMSAFCLGEPQTIDGGEFLVFKLKNGAFTA